MNSFQHFGDYTFTLENCHCFTNHQMQHLPFLSYPWPLTAWGCHHLLLLFRAQLILSAPRLIDRSPLRDWQPGFIADLSHTASKSIPPAVPCSLPSYTSTPNGSETSRAREPTGLKTNFSEGELAFSLISVLIHLSSCMSKSTSAGQLAGKPGWASAPSVVVHRLARMVVFSVPPLPHVKTNKPTKASSSSLSKGRRGSRAPEHSCKGYTTPSHGCSATD